VLLVVSAIAMIMIPSGAAGSNNKTLNCTSVEPNPVAATGSSVTFTMHLCNDTGSPNQLGSASITAPTGFVITAVTPPAGASWNPTTRVLTNLAIAPGSTKDVTIQATTPSLCADPTNLQWAIDARQSNDFNGNPGNKFSPDPKYVHQQVTGSCKLAFVNQPAETARTTAVRTTMWGAIDSSNPGDPIKVEVQAGGVHYSSPTGSVTIAVSGTSCAFTGDATTTNGFDANGYAIFAGLKMASVAAGCTLTATSTVGYIPSDPSNVFNVDPVQLYFKTQPADAVVNTVVTDMKYGGTLNPAQGNPIQVGVRVTNGSNTLAFNGSGSVSIAAGKAAGGTGTCQLTANSTKSTTFSGGVASFSNLNMASAPATHCVLAATGSNPPGYDSGTSDTFNVDQNGIICSGSCDTGPIASGDGNTTQVQLTNFTGTLTVNFTPTGLPLNVQSVCGSVFQGSPGAGAFSGDVILDPTSVSGLGPNATVIVNVAKNYLPKPPSQGNPFIPICAGGHRVDLGGTIYPCDPSTNLDGLFLPGWTTQSYAPATCVNDGLGNNFWGLLGTYNQNPHIPAQDPVISQWQGNPDGSRTFWISLGTIQFGQNWYWDWHNQPA
jgi:hypothetical protein